MKKRTLIIGVVAIGGLVAASALLSSLDHIVVGVVNEVGTRAAGAPVNLEAADVSLTDSKATLTELTIGNPEGFETPRAIRFGSVSVDLDESTITENPIVLRRVVMEGPEITVEIDTSGTNLAALRDNVRAFERSLRSGENDDAKPRKKKGGRKKQRQQEAPKSTAGDDGGGDDGTKFVIRELIIREGRIQFGATFLGKGTAGATLPEIRLENVGSADGGLTSAELAAEILSVLTDKSLGIVTDIGLDSIGDVLEGALDGALEEGKDLLDGLLGK